MQDIIDETLMLTEESTKIEQKPLSEDMAVARKDLPSGELSIHSQIFQVDDKGEVRCARIVSPKIDIVTIFFYPYLSWRLPLYAMEFVLLGKKPVVAVMDMQGQSVDRKLNSDCNYLMQQVWSDYPGLCNAEDPPDWFVECRSGSEFFLRPEGCGIDAFVLSEKIHIKLWNALLGQIQKAESEVFHDSKPQFIRDYKNHHKLNSPGLPLMNKSFGRDWVKRYFDGCFFH